MRINPCHGCPLRDGCKQRQEFRRRAAGIGARSVTFNCERLAAEVRPGRRVAIKSGEGGTTEDGEWCFGGYSEVKATVRTYRSGRFSCVVDPGALDAVAGDGYEAERPKARFRRAGPVSRIVRLLGEPDVPLCVCGRIYRDGACDRPAGEECECATYRVQPLEPRP